MRVKIINNPSSGRTIVQKSLEIIVGRLVLENIFKTVDKFDTRGKFDAMNEVMKIKEGEFDLIVVVGGDGTLNEVINGMMKADLRLPFAVIPAGTVNDFANYLSIPNDIDGICDMFRNGRLIDIDVCKVNENYFINVAAAGLLTDVAIKASVASKTVFGKFAYYAEGIKEIPKQLFKSIKLEFKYNCKSFVEDVMLFAVLNSSSAGGFKKFAPQAGLNDGKFDVCIFKKIDIFDAATLFLKIIRGDHINNENVIYFQTDNLYVKCLDDSNMNIDIDGENGGPLPAKFEIISSGLKIFIPDYLKFNNKL
ncbi:diacylglycerol kinase (ATP) [Caminicella sporogenes DSM 14501]|uniref:Diacylglycerol kinase (ATP) n=1 Tax=Caminicella sporogenes DSM 14501 TaxID=1121266 RepID=A0A1M6N193_9FIRM|nr:YegS/Rv2252/BmrU family lipid kinase [Caminicella sporogenes]RKD22407.1 hypothetical protein BET04_05070 [Caminicella sporogenes]SHJ89489.1 diacylglycerol kinase (ATP) [Caminicella sporogenes DSM 14501]